MLCKCKCGNHLTGKQRRFYSDACRKRHERAGRKAVRETVKNGGTVSWKGDLTTFSDFFSSVNSKLHLVEVLVEAAKYEEVWATRIMARPECSQEGQLEMFQESASFIRHLVDELSTPPY